MTTGSKSYGAVYSDPIYYRKSWSGADGLFLPPALNAKPGYYKVQYSRVPDRSAPKGFITVVSNKQWVQPKVAIIDPSSKAWHNYYSTSTLVRNTLGKQPDGSPSQGVADDLMGISTEFLSSNECVALENKLATAIRGHSFSLATAAAQPALTAEMVVSSIDRIHRSIKTLRHGNIPEALRILGAVPQDSHRHKLSAPLRDLKGLSDAWLEMQYGWKPLLQDVHDGAEAMAYHMNNFGQLLPGELRVKKSLVKKGSLLGSNLQTWYEYEKRISRKITIRFAQGPSSDPTSTFVNLGLTDPSSLAWEILPFSFVADWFIPIGTYLENRYQLPKVTGQYMVTDFCEVRGRSWALEGSSYVRGSSATIQQMSLNRSVSWNLNLTRPEFHVPKVSPVHFWNTLALLTSNVIKF